MYMGPITAARPPSGRIARRVVGGPVLLLAIVVAIPWIAAAMLVAGLVVGVRAATGLPRLLASAVDYAGEIAIGR